MSKELFEFVNRNGRRGIKYNFHEGQKKAWDSERRFVFILAGCQSGKTICGPPWVLREITRCGDGDYMVVSPSYPLQRKKVLPTYIDFFKHRFGLGDYNVNDRIFYLRNNGYNSKIHFGSADNPDSLESATAKAMHLDEVGQRGFKLSSWEAVLRRLSIHQGRILGTTTIYNLGWLKEAIYDRWKKGDEDIDVIQFSSVMNPEFPKEEYERAKETMPLWKFRMFYEGQYDIPAGMIYDSFNGDICKIQPIRLDLGWPRHVGIDFGGVNTAILWYAEEKINAQISNYYLYREYLGGNRSAAEHVTEVRRLSEGEWLVNFVGGSWSEGQWRREWAAAGINVRKPPISDVEVGIDRVYGLHQENRIYVFNTCNGYLDEKMRYSRKLDDRGEPTEAIEDKQTFHRLDAERYIMSHLVGIQGSGGIKSRLVKR